MYEAQGTALGVDRAGLFVPLVEEHDDDDGVKAYNDPHDKFCHLHRAKTVNFHP